jgi:hypothetical protein
MNSYDTVLCVNSGYQKIQIRIIEMVTGAKIQLHVCEFVILN